MAASRPTGTSSVNERRFPLGRFVVFLSVMILAVSAWIPPRAVGQAVPYARTFPKSKDEVDKVLKDLQAYAGQKLPIVDGFVATSDRPLNRYERAFYQFSIDLLPASSDGTIVRLTAKITAWYADSDPAKSGYQVLPSNGRLELDLLDRLTERFGGKSATSILRSDVQAPKPKIDLSTGLPGSPVLPSKGSAAALPSAATTSGDDEMGGLRAKREAEEKRMRQLSTELQSLQDIQHNQAHPLNLVAVKKSGTPVLARPAEGSRVLFTAAADDEFEFLDADGEWIHVQISGASRGYIRRSNVELPEVLAARLKSPNGTTPAEKPDAFRLTREETATFPGDWEALRGKPVKIYTVQPVSQDPKDTGAQAKLNFAASLFRKFSADSAAATPSIEGVVVIFDSADGGIIGSTLSGTQQFASGSLSQDAFWKQCYLDPPEAFQSHPKP
jgi:hypothetical protein